MQTLTSKRPSWNVFDGNKYDTGSLVYRLKGYTSLGKEPAQAQCTLVTQQHAITAQHVAQFCPGRDFTFIGKNNKVYVRRCTQATPISNMDMGLLTFSEALPLTPFDVAKVFPADLPRKFPASMSQVWDTDGTLERYVPGIVTDQMKRAFVADLRLLGFPYGCFDPSVWFPNRTDPYWPYAGDSGSGAFLVVKNNLVLLGPQASWLRHVLFTTNPQGTLRNNFSGWVGFKITVGAYDLLPASIGRWVVAGNNQQHVLKIVDASGNDVPGLSATINTASAAPGTFAINPNLNSGNVTLKANTTYHVVCHETAGGDQWYDYSACPVTMLLNNASFVGAAYADDTAPQTYLTVPTTHTYGPLALYYKWGVGAPRVDLRLDEINALVAPRQLTQVNLDRFPNLW